MKWNSKFALVQSVESIEAFSTRKIYIKGINVSFGLKMLQ